MLASIGDIEQRLRELRVPDEIIKRHLQSVNNWRKKHKRKVKRIKLARAYQQRLRFR
jgi:hypothetical protein